MQADVDVQDTDGRTALFCLFNVPELGRYLISKGADVFTRDDTGQNVLEVCMEYGESWIVDEFQELGLELAVLNRPYQLLEYVKALICGGFAARAKVFIDRGYVSIHPETACELVKKARDNLDNMKHPVETFDLLMRLGGTDI